MRVELVTVGDELLQGKTVNTNAAWLGESLLERGIQVARVTVVPDLVEEIVDVVNAARERADAVIVTGGLGPTHDDRTMAAIATAFDVDLVEHEGARRWIVEETARDPASLAPGTLDLPAGARFVPNDVGLAPGAILETVYVLPGVPAEMEAMFGRIAAGFEGATRHEAELDIAQPERTIADLLAEAERRFDVIVGSYPGKTVRVRIQGTRREEVERARAWLAARVDAA